MHTTFVMLIASVAFARDAAAWELAVKLENPFGERVQEIRIDGHRLRASASYGLAFLGEQAVPAEHGSGRESIGMSAVDALRRQVTSVDVVESDIVGSVTLV